MTKFLLQNVIQQNNNFLCVIYVCCDSTHLTLERANLKLHSQIINNILSATKHEFIKQGNSHFYFLQVASILKQL